MAETAKSHHRILPLRVYFGVAGALMILTVVTVAVSFVHLGSLNIVIALLIAAVKATLVVLYFMHLRYEWGMHVIVLLVAVIFLAVFLTITMLDVSERGQVNPEKRFPIKQNAVIYDDSGKPLHRGEHSGHETADSTSATVHETDDSTVTKDKDSVNTAEETGH